MPQENLRIQESDIGPPPTHGAPRLNAAPRGMYAGLQECELSFLDVFAIVDA